MQPPISIRNPAKQIMKLNRLIAKNRAQLLILCAAMQQSQSLLQGFNGHGKFPSSARGEIRSLNERAQRLRQDSLRLIERCREISSEIRRGKWKLVSAVIAAALQEYPCLSLFPQ